MCTDRHVNAHGYRCAGPWRPALHVKMSSLVACPPYFLDMQQTVSARFTGQQGPRRHLSPIPSAGSQVCTVSSLVGAWGSEQRTPCWYASTSPTGQVSAPYFPSFIEILILFVHYLKISLSVSDDKNNSVSLRLFPDVCFGLLVEVYLPETSIVFFFFNFWLITV